MCNALHLALVNLMCFTWVYLLCPHNRAIHPGALKPALYIHEDTDFWVREHYKGGSDAYLQPWLERECKKLISWDFSFFPAGKKLSTDPKGLEEVQFQRMPTLVKKKKKRKKQPASSVISSSWN